MKYKEHQADFYSPTDTDSFSDRGGALLEVLYTYVQTDRSIIEYLRSVLGYQCQQNHMYVSTCLEPPKGTQTLVLSKHSLQNKEDTAISRAVPAFQSKNNPEANR